MTRLFVAEQIAGLNPRPIDESGIPRVTYSEPEIASIGFKKSTDLGTSPTGKMSLTKDSYAAGDRVTAKVTFDPEHLRILGQTNVRRVLIVHAPAGRESVVVGSKDVPPGEAAAEVTFTAATTLGWRCPLFTTPMPPPKSMSRLPSASVTTAFSAWTTASGVVAGTPRGTALARRAASAWLLGPGSGVTREMTPAIGAIR